MTLYVVQARGADQASLERAVVVRDGFSWGAFIFAQFWLLYRRLWLPLLVWVVLEGTFIALALPHVSAASAAADDLLARLYLGLEGRQMRLAKGERRAGIVDVVAARDGDEAERLFFHRRARAGAVTPAPDPAA